MFGTVDASYVDIILANYTHTSTLSLSLSLTCTHTHTNKVMHTQRSHAYPLVLEDREKLN